MEAYTQWAAGPVRGAARSNICQLLEWGVDPVGHTWKFYFEYAPFGDVNQLIQDCGMIV